MSGTSNKKNIKDDFGAVLATIFAFVSREMLTADEIDSDKFPAACFGAAQGGTPAPEYEMFGNRKKYLDIVVWMHVKDPDSNVRDQMLSDLEEQVDDALMVDPTRGHWAIDTLQVEDTYDDTANPETDQDTGTSVLRYRCGYYPDD